MIITIGGILLIVIGFLLLSNDNILGNLLLFFGVFVLVLHLVLFVLSKHSHNKYIEQREILEQTIEYSNTNNMDISKDLNLVKEIIESNKYLKDQKEMSKHWLYKNYIPKNLLKLEPLK